MKQQNKRKKGSLRMKETIIADAKNAIIEMLDGYVGYYCDIHDYVFNSDYYIIGEYESKRFLEEFGVFDALDMVRNYELDNFGEIYTDFSSAEKIVNMLYYIVSYNLLMELEEISETFRENWNNQADDETNEKILEEISEADWLNMDSLDCAYYI